VSQPIRKRRGPTRVGWILAVVGLMATATAWADEVPAPPNGSCLTCHNRIAFDPARYAAGVHGHNACADCHRAFHGDPHGQAEVPPPSQEWLQRVLAVAPYSESNAWGACANCHQDVLVQMEHSRHIVPMVEEGTGEGAFCGDCHGDPHYITGAPRSPRERFEFINRTCVPCHQDPERIQRYHLNPDVVYTYETSIHGRVARLSPDNAPTCVDCHEAHAVMGPEQPGSPLALDHRAQVCAKCHEGANENFASVVAHSRVTREGTPVAYWTTVFFASLTLSVIVLLVLHMLLDMIAGVREAFRRRS
jgi:hypothetical protein